ncbi:MAG: hypothetical protein V9E89_09105 [Ilumatobacteraceae bacterium]|jgi:hypothetical protein
MVAERATVLITVKASPEIGRTHGETVCVAGIRLDGDDYRWIRLFPVQWQWFWQGEHPKYQVIELEIDKHDKDQRPESYRPRLDTTAVLDQLPAGKRRAEVLNRLPQYRMCDLVAAKGWARPSLGLVVPREITGFTREDHTGDTAHAAKMNRAAQGSLLAQGAPKLEFSPFTFKLAYRCQSASCRGHEQSIVDWEISEAWRNWRRSYPTDYLDRIEEKWLSLVDPARLPALYVGNQHQAPQGFLVLGIARDVTPVEPTPVGPGPGDTAPRSSDGRSTDPPRSTEGRLFDL